MKGHFLFLREIIAKYIDNILKNVLFQNQWANFNHHSRIKEIQVCPNEGPPTFSRGDNSKIEKNASTKFVFKTTGSTSTKAVTLFLWVKGI